MSHPFPILNDAPGDIVCIPFRPVDVVTTGRREAIAAHRCVLKSNNTCAGDGMAFRFRDQLSLAEYKLSGLCQACQDEAFTVEE